MSSTFRAVYLSSLLAVAATGAAQAFENGVTPYPPGSPGSNFGELPPVPGIFMLEQTNVQGGSSLYGTNGNKQAIPPFKSQAVSNTPRILLSYGIHLPFNGLLYGQIVPPLVFLHTEVFGQSQKTNGLANLTLTPLIASWHPVENLATTIGFDFILPTGNFSKVNPAPGTGYATYSPVFALRYDKPNGLDVGASQRLLINATDPNTGYHSGAAYATDFLAAWNFAKFKLGAVGGFLQQYGRDKVGGQVPNGGNRQETLGVGPNFTYTGLLGGKIPFSVNINYQVGVVARNALKANNFWLNIGLPLFAPRPHHPSTEQLPSPSTT